MRLVYVVPLLPLSLLIFFFVPDLSAGREREKERKRATKEIEREGESRRTLQTSVLAPCSQGQGCYRRESTVSDSFRTTKPYNKLGRERKRGSGVGHRGAKNLGFFPSETSNEPIYLIPKGFAAKVFFASKKRAMVQIRER